MNFPRAFQGLIAGTIFLLAVVIIPSWFGF